MICLGGVPYKAMASCRGIPSVVVQISECVSVSKRSPVIDSLHVYFLIECTETVTLSRS